MEQRDGNCHKMSQIVLAAALRTRCRSTWAGKLAMYNSCGSVTQTPRGSPASWGVCWQNRPGRFVVDTPHGPNTPLWTVCWKSCPTARSWRPSWHRNWDAANGGVTNGGLRGVWPPFLEIVRNRPKSPFFCLFRPFPEGAKSTWEIQKTEEKGLFPQISSDFLKPPSLKPPLAALQEKWHALLDKELQLMVNDPVNDGMCPGGSAALESFLCPTPVSCNRFFDHIPCTWSVLLGEVLWLHSALERQFWSFSQFSPDLSQI